MLYEGKIVWIGKTEEIDRSENEFIQQFINGQVDGPMAKLISENSSA